MDRGWGFLKGRAGMSTTTDIQVRWAIPRDYHAIAQIDAASFAPHSNWSALQYREYLRGHNVIGLVADSSRLRHTLAGDVAGFMTYELHDGTTLHLTAIAVHPAVRHQGVGRAMIAKLVSKMNDSTRRTEIRAATREGNLTGQLFLRGCGFRCVRIERRYYADGDDAYVFRLRRAEIGSYVA